MKMTLIIKNYKSLYNIKLDLNRLIVLTGDNGSGKSTLMNIIKLVKDIYKGKITNFDKSPELSEFKFHLRHDTLIEFLINDKSVIKIEQDTINASIKVKNLGKKNLRSTSFITSPEANLFPTHFQEAANQIGVLLYNDIDVVVSTHSYLILEALNNLIIAGIHYNDKRVDKSKLKEVIPKNRAIKPNKISAYHIYNGELIDMIDKTTSLINLSKLSGTYYPIGNLFEELLALYPKDYKWQEKISV